jgi:predicted PurR-regulated permease PerM
VNEPSEPLSRVGLPTGGEGRPPGPAGSERLGEVARRAAVWGLVLLAIVVVALAFWKLRLLAALLFLAVVVAEAMRPGVEALARRRVPRSVGVAVHYVALFGLFALFVWLVVPLALKQVESALGVSGLPTSAGDLSHAAKTSTGVKHDILVALQKRLRHLPSASKLARPGLQIGVKAFEGVIGVFFVFASAAYWVFERDRAVDLVCSILPRPKRRVVRDTWMLIDLKLGAFVRGQLLLIAIVGLVLSLAFWAIGLPYWILIGSFAGLVDIVPVIGPLVAGVLAVGVGLTSSTQIAVEAAVIVLGVRLLEDYLIVPRVLGNAVGLTPLIVLVSITSVGVLFGGFAVILAIPLAAVASTLVDVIIRNRDPAKEEVPTVLFSPTDSEG